MNAIDIATSLTRAERSTITGLEREFCVLGCGEPTAKTLAQATARRPALVVGRRGDEFPEFALNDLGMAVKEAL